MTERWIERGGQEDEPHDMSRRLLLAREEERALLARELHDDVTQRLAVLSIELGRVELAGGPATPQRETLRAVRQELRHLSDDMHSLSHRMHPSVVDDVGLPQAVRAECEHRCVKGGVDISVDIGPLPVVGRDAALCLYRVLQEALNNVSRHACSRNASVVLCQAGGGLRLTVHDDGVGFAPRTPRQGRGLGLISMAERIRLVNGRFEFDSAPGMGTTLIAWVPAGRP
jgi:signal transduction histidine kinase